MPFFKPGTQPQVAKADLVMAIQGLAKDLQEVDSASSAARQTARKADWRSIALMRIISERFGLSEDDIVKKIEEVQIDAFNADSDNDDLNRKLIPLGPEETANEGMIAIIQVKTFFEGKLVANGGALRSKIRIGLSELVKEVDEALIGMKSGETKRFPLSLQGATDEAEVTLYGLRIQDTSSQKLAEQ